MHKKTIDFTEQDHFWMKKALYLAEVAASKDEVPVGAILIGSDNQILAQGFNYRETLNSPLAHAELITLHQASRQLQSWRLNNSTLYVTLEPCIMCAGAVIQARVQRVVFGCLDPKGGAIESLFRVFDEPKLNHRVEFAGGLYADESRALLQSFFKIKRLKK
ncbi:MAG: tRNA adenosine(34) deaminase TadA [Bdellovibrionota bacterium]